MSGKIPRRVVVIGAGGHAKVVIEALWATGHNEIVGVIDPAPAKPSILGVPVLGGDEILAELRGQGILAAVVGIGDNASRERIGNRLLEMDFFLPALVHPSAQISPSAKIEEGAVIMAAAVVGTETSIARLAIVNTGAILDHDNLIGIAAHIGPGCSLSGNVRVGDRTLVGVGSAVRPGIRIGSDSIIGAGSAVVADVPDRAVVGGVPARRLTRSRHL